MYKDFDVSVCTVYLRCIEFFVAYNLALVYEWGKCIISTRQATRVTHHI